MPPRIKQHGKAHFLLMLVMFLTAVVVFGGWTEGPLFSGAKVALSVFGFIGNMTGTGEVSEASSLVDTIIAFAINLIIYYVLAVIIIFFYNLLFGR
ncbi:hypothetical protein D6789_03650 [Candidatus Woesearchaeota archaeon]|nr:MAG: hypothetical protein D6789_03650 [Candidatus Woesearchaeota archaeon]